MNRDEIEELERLRERYEIATHEAVSRARWPEAPHYKEAERLADEARMAYIPAVHNALPSLIAAVKERDELLAEKVRMSRDVHHSVEQVMKLREWQREALPFLHELFDHHDSAEEAELMQLINQAEREGGKCE